MPFYLVWISLTLVYGLRVWPLGPTLFLLAAVVILTGIPIAMHVMGGTDAVEKFVRVPLMALLFLAVVWHARRRVEAVRIAESRAEELHSMLERQERFIHDASHELRTPLTIARGHLELLGEDPQASGELEIALDELSRIDAIVGTPAPARLRRAARLPADAKRSISSRSWRTSSCAGRRSRRGPGAWEPRPGTAAASTPTDSVPPSTPYSRTP